MDGCRNLLEFLSFFTCISWSCDEYKSCSKSYDLSVHKISALSNLCSQRYEPDTAALFSEKNGIPERWKLNFSTILTSESDFTLNTKVVEREII